jgi:hypothetical protein
LPYAKAPIVCAPQITHEVQLALRFPIARLTLPRPPHPAPNVRDDRDTPLFRDGTVQEKIADLG